MAIGLRALPFAAASALLCAAFAAHAGGPIGLTDGQLDSVAAGNAFVTANAGGQATGLYTQGAASTIAATNVGSNSPFGGSGGFSSGTAFVTGSNVTTPGTASTSVTTSGGATGNLVYVETFKDSTLSGAPIGGNGWSFSAGFTFAFGGLVPGCGATCP